MAVPSVNLVCANDVGCHEVPLTRPPKTSWTEEEATIVPSPSPQRTKGPRYDIATLLLLRATSRLENIQLRINPAALTEEIFRSSSQRNSYSRIKYRARAGTSAETFDTAITDGDHRSYGSIGAKNWQLPPRQMHDTVEGFGNPYNSYQRSGSTIAPIRQPYAPPKTPLLQKDRGFANFIKEHASPTHVRVTAGGRIVPSSQPPMMSNFANTRRQAMPNIFGKVEPDNQAQAGSNDDSNFFPQGINQGSTYGASLPMQWNGGTFPSTQQQVLTGVNAFPQAIYPVYQMQYGPLPPMTLNDGSLVHVQNGVTYRSFFNGYNVVTEVLNAVQSFAMSIDPIAGVPHTTAANTNPVDTVPEPALKLQQPQAPSGTAMNGCITDIMKTALQMELEDFKKRLTALDKHIALHRHRMSPNEYTACINQRKQFVESIDNTRTKLEPSTNVAGNATANTTKTPRTHTIKTGNGTYIATNHGTHETYDYLPIPGSSQTAFQGTAAQNTSKRPLHRNGSQQNGVSVDDQRSARPGGLSPVAPSFVPTVASAGAPNAMTQRQPGSWDRRPNETKKPPQKLQDVSLRHAEDIKSKEVGKHSLKIEEFCERRQISPAMRRKLFCSTEDDFAAVIQRVREQAAMLGCKGGQSKDPAYDAEQDIRWAMADGDPIPLADNLPEYFFNPRPWNWEDSEFNYRVPMKKVEDANQEFGGFHRECITSERPSRFASVAEPRDKPQQLPAPSVGLKTHADMRQDASTAVPDASKDVILGNRNSQKIVVNIRRATISGELVPQTPKKPSKQATPLKEVSGNAKANNLHTSACKVDVMDFENKEQEQVDPSKTMKEERQPTTPTRTGRAERLSRLSNSGASPRNHQINDDELQKPSKAFPNLSPTKVGVPRFLQKLLRSPRQSAATSLQPNLATVTTLPSQASTAEISRRLSAVDERIERSATFIPSLRRTSRLQAPHRGSSEMYRGQVSGSQKAQSSVASSELNVQGYVPQIQRSNLTARHHLQPWKNSSMEEPRVPQYDGADDMPPLKNPPANKSEATTTSGSSGFGAADGKDKSSVTTFQTYQQDLPRDHGLKVDRFFKELAEEEKKEMEAVEAKGGKV